MYPRLQPRAQLPTEKGEAMTQQIPPAEAREGIIQATVDVLKPHDTLTGLQGLDLAAAEDQLVAAIGGVDDQQRWFVVDVLRSAVETRMHIHKARQEGMKR
jgi:hypothetical protein